jgi:hypothetical protein
MAILTVGVGQEYATLSAAIAVSQNGDTIDIQAGTYTNDFAEITDNITIQGVGGMVSLVATAQPPNGKAILVTDGNDTINDVSFSGATVPDANGAGIRYQSGNLVLNDDYFFNNQEGLLAAANPAGSITINDTEFANNGTGSGNTHNLYVGEVGTLTIENSLFTGVDAGHEIKSRADNTIIENNRIIDGSNATASYSIDIPDGGNAIVENNIIEKGINAQNESIIHYGGEGGPYANSSLTISNNTIIDDSPLTPNGLLNQTDITATITNNQLYGIAQAQLTAGPANVSGNTVLATEPTLDFSPPYLNITTPSTPAVPDDFNGDGTSDILWQNTDGTVGTWEMEGSQILAETGFGQVANSWQIVGTGDFNGNGISDILWQNTDGAVALWQMNGTQTPTESVVGQAGSGWQVAGTGDFIGDGNDDILWRNTNGAVGLWEMDGTQIVKEASVGQADNSWQIVGVGDFNGDGKSDILWQNTNGTVGLWETNSTPTPTESVIGQVGSGWSIAGVGDFNGDGKDEILLQNTNGSLETWEMNGTQVLTQAIAGQAGPGWQIAGIGDYNGDGKSDILWRNTNGAIAMWETNGAQPPTQATVGQADTSWHIA